MTSFKAVDPEFEPRIRASFECQADVVAVADGSEKTVAMLTATIMTVYNQGEVRG